MSVISSVPVTRVSDMLVRQRLLGQVQFDQLSIMRLQMQVATGQRIFVPSEDPAAALRAIAIQGLLQRKAQVTVNIQTNSSYLSASESALGNASTLLNDARALGLSAAGSGMNSTQRAAAVASLNDILGRMVEFGNQQFRGRYLFAGSLTTTKPFTLSPDGVMYSGDTKKLLSYADIDTLFESNVTGDQVFGALSSAVTGTMDLNPTLLPTTALADLHGGQGISRGSIAVSDGLTTSIINISGAATISDVARLLESNPPAGRTITARVTNTGLEVSIDSSGGGNLSIREVGGGTTANELGILHLGGTGTAPIVGRDLNPALTQATRIDDIMGTRAEAFLAMPGVANDLIIQAATNGVDLNGVKVVLVNDAQLQAAGGLQRGAEVATYTETSIAAVASLVLPGASNDLLLTANTPGAAMNGVRIELVDAGAIGDAATVSYDALNKVLTIGIDNAGQTSVDTLIAEIDAEGTFTATRDSSAEGNVAGGFVPVTAIGTNVANTGVSGADPKTLRVRIASGVSTANDVIAAINASGTFTARLDYSEPNNTGAGVMYDSALAPEATATTSGGSGTQLDRHSGLLVQNAGKTQHVDLSQVVTIQDLLNAFNSSPTGILAEINATATGINVRSRTSGSALSIGENGGNTASQLGVRSFALNTPLAQLNGGKGVPMIDAGDFIVTARDGTQTLINLGKGNAASARLEGGDPHSALLVSRVEPGTAGNQFRVEIIDSGSGGGNSVSLDGNTLRFSADIAAGFTALDAQSLLASHPTLSTQFVATLDRSADPTNDGTGNLAAAGPTDFSHGQGKALTIGDVLSMINNHPTNLASASPVVAQLASVGNGIELHDINASGTHALSITAPGATDSARALGLIPPGQTSLTAQTADRLTGTDTNPIQVRGVFTALIMLRDAIAQEDMQMLGDAMAMLDEADGIVLAGRAELGLRLQNLESLENRLADENIELRRALSDNLDADLAQVTAELLGRQVAYEASLRAAGSIARMSLLNFL